MDWSKPLDFDFTEDEEAYRSLDVSKLSPRIEVGGPALQGKGSIRMMGTSPRPFPLSPLSKSSMLGSFAGSAPVTACEFQNAYTPPPSHASAPQEPAETNKLDRLETTNFRIQRPNLTTLCGEIKDALLRHRCDFTFACSETSVLFTCKGFVRGCCTCFNLSVYGSRVVRQSPEFVLELQLRRGDCLQFSHIFDKLRSELMKEDGAPKKKRRIFSMDPLPLPDSFSAPRGKTVATKSPFKSSTIASLTKMASSKYPNTQLEGLRSLAYLTHKAPERTYNPRLITRSTPKKESVSLLDVLLKTLSAAREESHCCAVTILANLFESKEAQRITLERVLERNSVASITDLVKPESPLEVLRASGRCLCALCPLLTSSASPDSSHIEAIRGSAGILYASSDPLVRSYGGKLYDRLS